MERIVRYTLRMVWWSILGVVFVLPYMLRVIAFTFRLMGISIVSLVVGVPKAVERISDAWMVRALAMGFPTEYDTLLHYGTSVAAFCTLVIGWILSALTTTGVIYVIGSAIVK